MKRRGLGRGLDTLLGGAAKAGQSGAGAQEIAIAELRPGTGQPRRYFDEAELQALAASIKEQGVVQPLIVRSVDGGGYGIVAGERRWRAAQLAGLSMVPAVVREMSDKEALMAALVENIQRADLNPVEQGRGIGRMIEELGLTHAEAADKLGMSRAAVSNTLRLLSLSSVALRLVEEGRLEAGHARALLPLSAAQQKMAATQIIKKNLSARQAEKLARQLLAADEVKGGAAGKDGDTRRLEDELSSHLSLRTEIFHRKNGGGKLVLHYGSVESLERVVKKLRR